MKFIQGPKQKNRFFDQTESEMKKTNIFRISVLLMITLLLIMPVPSVSALNGCMPFSVGTEAELNAAIACYNSETAPAAYTITITANINLTASPSVINNTIGGVQLVIEGNGHSVDGQNILGIRPFEIAAGTQATLQNITVSGGHGGFLSNGGGILNNGTLTITNSSITSNTAYSGGGIANTGSLTVTSSSISGNTVEYSGGGVYNSGTFSFNNSIFENNDAMYGGAIFSESSLISNIANSTLAENSVNQSGGAIYTESGHLILANSVVYHNTAEYYAGIDNNNGTLSLFNITISNNKVNDPSVAGAGLFSNGTLHYVNTIIANSTGSADCWNTGSILTNVSNLVESNVGCSPAISLDPKLGPLGNYGGSTPTLSLLAGSPAIDQGDNSSCTSSPVNGLDQRGATRPIGANCDIGAFENNDKTLAAIPATYNFGEQGIGTTNALFTFKITNQGGDYLNVGTLAISGEFALSNNTCNNAKLAFNEICTFGVTFLPLSTGAKTGSVSIPSDAASSPDSLSLSGTGVVLQTLRLRSNGANDGMVRESSETSGLGNYTDPANQLIAVGDDSLKRQYIGILDFDTSSLPDNAVITSARVQVKVTLFSSGIYAKLGNLTADITNPYFGNSVTLQNMDFGLRARANAGIFTKATDINQWIALRMKSTSLFAVNPLGHTQFRLRFTLDDSNDLIKHQIGFLSGDYRVLADRPLFIITYYVP
jgi:hypothetical protein